MFWNPHKDDPKTYFAWLAAVEREEQEHRQSRSLEDDREMIRRIGG